jgi:hypothetical protein
MLIGVLGFFTAVTFLQTVILELQGKSALGSALILLLFVVLLWLAVRWRRRSPPVGGP